MAGEDYPEHLTIVDLQGGDNESSELDTPQLEAKINALFKEQEGGAKKKKSKKTSKKKSSKKRSSKKKKKRSSKKNQEGGKKKRSSKKASSKKKSQKGGKKTLPPALKAWNELLDKIIKKTNKSRGEAMSIAKKLKDGILVKTPQLKTDYKKLYSMVMEKI